MPSFDKLITLKFLKNNAGMNKHFSFSGQHFDQIVKNSSRFTSRSDCLQIQNNSGKCYFN